MKKHSEDELQRLLEDEAATSQFLPMSAEDRKELEVYNHLFELLKKEPEAGPSYNFSHKVRAALRSEMKSKERKKSYISMAFTLFICIAGILGVMLFTDSLFHTGLVEMVLSGKWIFIFCLICLFLVQFADQKILLAKLDHIEDNLPL